MDDELTPEQQFAAEDAETLVPRALLLGKKPDEIVADLIKLDWSPAAAKAFVDRVCADIRQFRESPEGRQRLIDHSFKQFIGGTLVALLGIGILTIPFFALLRGLVMLSVLVVGLLVFGGGFVTGGRGWSRWRLYKNWAKNIAEAGIPKTDQAPPTDDQAC